MASPVNSRVCSVYALLLLFTACCFFSGCAGSGNAIVVPDGLRPTAAAPGAVNINSAGIAELERVPHIGKNLAERIVRHREDHGPFAEPEHLMLVPGISDKRFRQIRNYIKAE